MHIGILYRILYYWYFKTFAYVCLSCAKNLMLVNFFFSYQAMFRHDTGWNCCTGLRIFFAQIDTASCEASFEELGLEWDMLLKFFNDKNSNAFFSNLKLFSSVVDQHRFGVNPDPSFKYWCRSGSVSYAKFYTCGSGSAKIMPFPLDLDLQRWFSA